MRLTKRLLSAILVLVMVFSMLPLQAFASEVHTEDGGGMKLPVQGAKPTEAQEEVAARVELNESSAMISVGNTFTFVPTLFSDQGEQMESKMDFKWESSNPEVATVENGAVTGVAEGLATITCSYGNLQTTAIVSVTKATYQLTYEIDYPDDAKKVAYQNGGKATIIKPQDTRITVSCEPGKTVVIPSDLASTINYQLTGFTDGEKQYQVGESIAVSTNMTLKSCWTPIEGAGSEGSYETIYVTYRSNDKRVTKEVTAFVLPDARNNLKGTATFITANNNDTIATGNKAMCGWTINNVAYGLNQQVTVPVSRYTLLSTWTVDAYARYETVKENEAYAEFFVRKSDKVNEEGFGADKYFSIGSRKIKIDPNWDTSTRIDGAEVAKYLLDPPTAEEVANLMNESLPAGAVVDWNHLSKLDTGFHVDGVIRTAGKYWNVKFIDPDNNRCVQQVPVLDEDKISTIYDGNRLNTNVRTFIGWSFQPDGKPIDNLSEKTVNGDITLYALFDRKPAYTVRAKLYVGTPNGKAELLTEKVETDLTLDQLKAMYNQSCSELATHFWKGVGQSGMHGTARWTPEGSADPNRQSPKEHIVELYLKEGDVQNVSVTLAYDGNGEEVTGVPDVVKTIKGESVQISSTTPTRPGYTFKGWNTEKNGAGNQYGGENGATTITLDQSTTLYAQWEAKTANYTVKHYLETETDGQYPDEATYTDAEVTVSIGTVIKRENVTNSYDGYELDTVKTEDTFTIGPDSADNVIEVYYKRSAYTVTYQVDGEQYERPYTVRYGTKHDLIPEPTETGHSFSGWRVISDGVTIQTGEDGKSYITMPAGNVTIEGSFTKLTNLSYTVNYYWNGDRNTPIHEPKTVGGQTFDTTVPLENSERIEIPGYTLIDATYNVKIGADSSKNVINVYYRKNVTVKAPQNATVTYGEKIVLPKEAIENLPENLVQDFGENVRYTMTVDAQKNSPVDSYPIYFKNQQGEQIQSPMTMGNYLVTFVPGTLTIQPAESLSVQPFSYEGIYDGQSHGGEAAVFVNGEEFTDATVSYYVSDSMDGPWEEQNSYPTIQNVGEFYVMVVAEHNNYNTAVDYAHFQVTPKEVTVKAPQNVTGVYGQTVSIPGEKLDPSIDKLPADFTETVKYEMVCEATSTSPVTAEGYPIYFTRNGEIAKEKEDYGNYLVTFVPGTLTITKSDELTITAEGGTWDYDGLPHGEVKVEVNLPEAKLTYSTDGVHYAEDVPTIRDVSESGKTFYVKASLANYAEKTATYTLTVKPRVVTITAPENVSAVYGQAMPVLAPTVAPTVQELPDDFYETVDYDMVCEATSTSPAGEYPISFTRDGQTVEGLVKYGNYDVTFVPSTLIITEADGLDLSITDYSNAYDGQPHTGRVTSTTAGTTIEYLVNGEWTETAPTITDVGTETYTVRATNPNYQEAKGQMTVTVNKRLVTVTSASSEKVYDGTPLTAGMESETGWVGEEGAEYTFHASVTNVTTGEGIPNTFSYEAKEGTNLDNYVIKMVNGTLKVNPKPIKVKADNQTMTYGGDVPALTAQLAEGSALAGRDAEKTLAEVIGGYTMNVQYKDGEPNVGEHSIAFADRNGVRGNYDVTFIPGKLTITASDSLTISAVGGGWTYDGEFHAGTVTVKRGDEVVSTELSYRVKTAENAEYGEWTKTVPEIQNVGNLYVEVKASLANYVEKTATYTLTVNPKPIKVKADDKGMTYGGDVPALTAQLAEGSALADVDAGKTLAEVIGGYTMNVQYKDGEPNVGEHPIVFVDKNGVRGNYDVTFVPGKLTITASDSLTISAVGGSWTYDGEFHAGTVTVKRGDEVVSAELSYRVKTAENAEYGEWAKTVPEIQNVGTLYVEVKASLDNYVEKIATYTLTVNPKPIKVKADDKGMTYGGDVPALTAQLAEGSALADVDAGKTLAEVIGGYTMNVQYKDGEPNVGEHSIAFADKNGVRGNYDVTFVSGKLTIQPAGSLSVQPFSYEGIYDGQSHGGEATVFVNGEEFTDATVTYYVCDSLNGPWEKLDSYPTIKDVDEFYVMVVAEHNNYNTAVDYAHFHVTPKEVTVKAPQDATVTYGEEIVLPKETIENLPEDLAQNFEANVRYTMTVDAQKNSPVDSYPIYFKNQQGEQIQSPMTMGNYLVTFVPSKLTILAAPVTITVPNGTKTYGEGNPELAIEVMGLVNGNDLGDITYRRTSTVDNAGIYTDDLWPVYTENPNYTVTEVPGTLTILAAPVTITVPNGTKTYGQDNPELTMEVKGLVKENDLGEITYRRTSEAELVGVYADDLWPVYTENPNYTVTEIPGTLTIEAPTSGEGTGIVTKTHEDKTYNPGEWVRFTISATNIYNQPATLTIVEQLENVVFEQVENVTMAPGETLTFEAQYQVTEADILRGSLSNTIDWTIAPNEGSSIGGTVTDPVDLAGRNSAMTVEKTIEDQKDSYRVGDVISFQILVKNTGNVTLHNLELTDRLINANGRVTFTETNGASLSGGKLLLAQLAPGQQWTVKCSYTVTEADAGKNIGNAATVTPEDGPTITDETDKPAPVEQRYTLTIRYLNTAGVSIHPDYTGRYHAGDRYEIASPAVAGYTLTADSVVRSGVMGEGDKTLVVVYDRVPAPAPDPDPEPDPDPAPDPDPDPDPAPNPDPDAPAPDPDPDPEADPAQQTEPQDNTEPVLQPGTYLEDPEDHTLTPIDEEETPLANVNLNGHTCCILHFLLMLAAMVVCGFDTKSRKKHQARIFELKRQLAMKDDQNDSQQS